MRHQRQHDKWGRVHFSRKLNPTLFRTLFRIDEVAEVNDELRKFIDELPGFIDEVAKSNDELPKFNDEPLRFIDEVAGFIDEFLEFIDELPRFIDELPKLNDELNNLIDEVINFIGGTVGPGCRGSPRASGASEQGAAGTCPNHRSRRRPDTGSGSFLRN